MIPQDSSKLGWLKDTTQTIRIHPKGVANVEVILFNQLMQERWKGQTEQWKGQTEQWKGQTEQWKGQIEQQKGF
jgi:hypothetical protein